MIRCKRMGWRESGNLKVRHVFYDLSKSEVMDKLLKALGRDPVIKAQDVYDHDAGDLSEDKLLHVYGAGVKTRLVKSDDPRDKGRASRQSDEDRINHENDVLLKAVARAEKFLREKEANAGDTCPKHGKTLVANGRCPVCGLGYRFNR